MKKKFKLFLSISSLCFALAVLCFGVYAVQTVNYSLSGNVTYTVEDAFVEVQTKLYKSTTNLTSTQLVQKVNAIAEMDFASTPEGLTLVDTSAKANSTSGTLDPYTKNDLKFSSKVGEECYAYFFVINIKNLSPDINVWAVMEDDLTDPENTIQKNNGLQQTINQAGKNMVIGLTVDDLTQNIPTENNAFRYSIKIGVGTYAVTETNLNKLTLTLDTTNNVYSVKAKDASVKGVVAIPESYTATTTEVSNLARKASYQSVALSEEVIPDGVTSIGDYAFSNCTDLTSIFIPDSVTKIGYGAFSGCTGLNTITIPSRVTIIERSVFSGCTGLTNVTIPDGVTDISYYAFDNCKGLTSIIIPSSVTSISTNAFSGCTSLTSVIISEGVKIISNNAFENCTSLTSIEIPNGVTSIDDYAFSGCTGLTQITIKGVTRIDYNCFLGCTNLNTITILSDEISIDSSAFEGCESLKNIDNETGLIYLKGKNSDGTLNNYLVLYGTTNTTQETYTINENCKYIASEAFKNCTSLTSIEIPNGVTSIDKNAFCDCTALTRVTIPNTVTNIGDYAFSGCSGLTSIEIPSSITRINKNTFYGCGLKEITIPNGVTSIGDYAFSNCNELTKVIIANSVKTIETNAFASCSNLVSITIPDSVESIGVGAFSGCSVELQYEDTENNLIYIKNTNSDGTVNNYFALYGTVAAQETYTINENCKFILDNAFYGRTDLTSITIPNSIVGIGDFAFTDCTGLTEIIFPSSLRSLGSEAFSGCTGLTQLTIPRNLTSIKNNTFSGCGGLDSIDVEAGNTAYKSVNNCLIEISTNTLLLGCKNSVIPTDGSVTTIGGKAFKGCTGLEELTIPSSVTSVGEYAFSGWQANQTIKVSFAEGNVPKGWNWAWKFGCSATVVYAS